MRKTLIALAAVSATAAFVPPAADAEVRPPGTCDLIKNTICHYLPPADPTNPGTVCGIVYDLTMNDCRASFPASAQRPPVEVPTSGCDLQEKLGIVNVRQCEDPASS